MQPSGSASRGTTEHVTAHYVEEIKGYRALFDVRPAEDRDGNRLAGTDAASYSSRFVIAGPGWHRNVYV